MYLETAERLRTGASISKRVLGLYEELGDRGRVAKSLEELAWVESYRGNDERATAFYQEALALGREVGNKRYIAIDLWYLGIVATLRGDPNRAKALLKEALTIDLELKQWDDVAEDLKGLAEAAGALGEDVRAARLWGAAGALRDAIGDPWRSNERRLHEPQLIAAQSRIDEALWEAGFAEGRAMGLEKAVEYALSEEETYASTDLVPDRSPPVEPTGILTRREEEVAAMIAKGLSNRQIAQELYLSERTIENHVSKILRKLDLTSRTKIAAWETQQRLIAPNPD